MKRHVALIIETSSGYGRELLRGVVRFMRLHDDWPVFLEQRDLTKKPPAWLADWNGDGILSRATTPALVEAVKATGVPLVELTDRRADSGLPFVRSDDAAIGQMAAEHLLERGFQQYGFCGFSGEAWSHRREEGFVKTVRQAGWTCSVYNAPWHGRGSRSWREQQARLAKWLADSARPIGIMACNDVRGQHVLDVCSTQDIAVPEDVAVIGVDNDELICRICSPPLSSVIPDAERVGFQGAELLSALMDRDAPDEAQLVTPVGVATRHSSDVVAILDPMIAEAVRFIREHACQGLSVNDVTNAVHISRSTLERKIRQYFGRTPQEEIRQVQTKRVRELLVTSDLTAEQIAYRCGFEHPEYMHVVFKRLTGMTPGEFRARHQPDNISQHIDETSH